MVSLQSLGWDDTFREQLEQLDDSELKPARVAVAHSTQFQLLGADIPVAELTGRLREACADPLVRPTVGDWVAVKDHRIHHVLARKTQFVRQAAGGRTRAQVVAANIDTVFAVTSANRDFNPRRIERYLTAIWESGARPVVIINKADLDADVEAMVAALEEVALGVPVLPLSALTQTGIAQLEQYLGPGHTVALVGSSGVGKSTLINCLLGRELQNTAAIRQGDGKGRHTTTRRELIVLEPGGVLIDTPGMRELQLWDAGQGVSVVFDDIESLAEQCRFRDCTHQGEPGCAVAGQITTERLHSYNKLLREQAYQERQRDALSKRQSKQRWRQMTVAMRARKKLEDKFRGD